MAFFLSKRIYSMKPVRRRGGNEGRRTSLFRPRCGNAGGGGLGGAETGRTDGRGGTWRKRNGVCSVAFFGEADSVPKGNPLRCGYHTKGAAREVTDILPATVAEARAARVSRPGIG